MRSVQKSQANRNVPLVKMMAKRLTDRQVVWSALVHAYDYADSLSDAYRHDPDEKVVQEQRRLMAAYERVAQKYYGRGIKETVNKPFKGARVVSIQEIWRKKDDGEANDGCCDRPATSEQGEGG